MIVRAEAGTVSRVTLIGYPAFQIYCRDIAMNEVVGEVLEYWLVQAGSIEFWWQVLVLVFATSLAFLINQRVQVVLELQVGMSGLRHLAVRSMQRLLWPLSALLLMLPGKAILEYYEYHVVFLDVAVPILLALAAVRIVVYVMRKAFTVNPLLKSTESVLALSIWALLILHLLGWLPAVLGVLDSMALQLGETRLSVLSTLQFLLVVGVAFTLAVWLSEVISRKLRQATGISPSMQVGISKLARLIFITLAFLFALNAVGINLSSLAIFGGALGVGLGFGLQRIASNFISGFILVLDRSIKPGDVVTVGENFGWVQELKARYVVVRNRQGVDTLIPNENLITSEVVNWSYMDRNVRLSIAVQISYEDDPEQAMALMLECAYASPRVLHEPEPTVRFLAFGESGLDLEMRVWIGDPENGFGQVKSDLNLAIWKSFKLAGITIPYPQRDLHIKNMPVSSLVDGE
jgi:small-conductance mechanosensitive channel